MSSWSAQIKKRKIEENDLCLRNHVRGFNPSWVCGFCCLDCLGLPPGTLVQCFTVWVLISCFQCFVGCGGCGFFFPKVVDFFSEGEEEELTEVFRRLWLSLIFFFFRCRGCFFQREKRKKEIEVSWGNRVYDTQFATVNSSVSGSRC